MPKSNFPERIKPMLASQDGDYLDKPNYILQQKYDGTRCIIMKKNGNVYLIGRSWKNDYSSKFPEIIRDVKKINLDNFILDSELTFFKGGKDEFLTALASPEKKRGYVAKCMVFDVLEYNGRNVRNIPLDERLKILGDIIPEGLEHVEAVKSYRCNHKKLFDEITSDDSQGEGVVLKNIRSKYEEDSRNMNWIKVKAWKSDEAIISGLTHGNGARQATFGAVILSQYDGKKLRFVGKTSGFSDADLRTILRLTSNIRTEKLQVSGVSASEIKYWILPRVVIEVKYQERTTDGKFRFPSFMRIRTDKTPEECVFKSSLE